MTTVARTIVDLAEILTAEQLANVMYEAAFRGLLDLEAVEATAARLTGRHGLATLQEAIDAHRKGSAGTKSEKEDAFHALVRGRMPKPIANVKVLGHEVDAYWPEFKLIAEIDGPGHGRPRARRRDARRDRELRAAGYIVRALHRRRRRAATGRGARHAARGASMISRAPNAARRPLGSRTSTVRPGFGSEGCGRTPTSRTTVRARP